ncbi:MAG: hypothetical protein ACFB5Z_10520 [Elainellaceae cyanobacterium]
MAYRSDEQDWLALPTGAEETIILSKEISYGDGDAVLVELRGENDVAEIKDATAWLLELVDQYLSLGLSPEDMREEVERIEEWRKSLTLKSQDVVRQTLEVETRRDQIQELETKLEQERKQLELMTEQLQKLETKLEQERQQLSPLDSAEKADTRLPDPTNTLG